MLNDLIEKNKKDLQSIEDSSENAVDQISKLAFLVSRDLEAINPVFLFNLKSIHNGTWEKYLEYFNGYFLGYVEKVLMRGKNEKYFRDDINEKIIARVWWELISLPTEKDIFIFNKVNPDHVKHQIYILFMKGILTSKGRYKLKHLKSLAI